jgi:DNA topoisomerase-6 subunit B
VAIGEAALCRGLGRGVERRFTVALTRRPAVYRGNPFVVEVAALYRDDAAGTRKPIELLRFANRTPLLFQQSHCAITQAVSRVHWSRYGLEQSANGLPLGPVTLLVHLASVWVPFTSESKEAIAGYAEIEREIELALQGIGRKLAKHVRHERRRGDELARRRELAKYLPYVGEAVQGLADLDDARRDAFVARVGELLEASRRLP